MMKTLNSLRSPARLRCVRSLAMALGAVLLPVAAQAQGGCIHSPECPTAVLGLVGAGGAALFARWRAR